MEIKISSYKTSYSLIEVIAKAGLTVQFAVIILLYLTGQTAI